MSREQFDGFDVRRIERLHDEIVHPGVDERLVLVRNAFWIGDVSAGALLFVDIVLVFEDAPIGIDVVSAS